jgi:hypothetical protein
VGEPLGGPGGAALLGGLLLDGAPTLLGGLLEPEE